MPVDSTQAEIFEVLHNPESWPGRPERVEAIETHAAIIVMAAGQALKVKRAIRLPYLDFSTLEQRRRFLARELEINRPHAPEIYQDLVPITRDVDGRLAIGGDGVPVEWALRMRRFPQDDLLSNVADRGGIGSDLARALAQMVVRYHTSAPRDPNATDQMPALVTSVLGALRTATDTRVLAAVDLIEPAMVAALSRSAAVRERRAREGYVRRCHGDLHLANIVVWQGRPVPFDAIEFDEHLATIDTLYDLAFLLMDLERRGARGAANLVLDRYLWQTGDPLDLEGLSALPLFLGLRASVRAMVALDRMRVGAEHNANATEHVLDTLALARRLLAPPPPRLVAIGGLSGTGKTTLAARLAPSFGAAPGALHVRTDLERKWLAGVGEHEPLLAEAYTPAAAVAVYARVAHRARLALSAGHSVVVDAVFARLDERDAIAHLAHDVGVAFQGVWLEAAPDALRERVASRRGDASDATPAVVDKQLATDTGPITWARLNASASPDAVYSAALTALCPTTAHATDGSPL